MGLSRFFATALVALNSLHVVAVIIGELDPSRRYMNDPDVQYSLERIKEMVQLDKVPHVDVRISPQFTKEDEERADWAFSSRKFPCGARNWYTRYVLSSNAWNNTHIQVVANSDHEMVNPSRDEPMAFGVSTSTAKTSSLGGHWSIERSNTEAFEDSTSTGQEKSSTSSTGGGGSVQVKGTVEVSFFGNGGSVETGVEGHLEHSEADTSGQSSSHVTSSTTSKSASSGQATDKTSSREDTAEVNVQAECPPRSICSVQTWTFTVNITDNCPRVLFYDFGRCLRHDKTSTIWLDETGVDKPSGSITAYPKMAMGLIDFLLPETKKSLAATITARFQHHKAAPPPGFRIEDGLYLPANDDHIDYKYTQRCQFTSPALRANGKPHRVQFLFVDPLDKPRRKAKANKRDSADGERKAIVLSSTFE